MYRTISQSTVVDDDDDDDDDHDDGSYPTAAMRALALLSFSAFRQ